MKSIFALAVTVFWFVVFIDISQATEPETSMYTLDNIYYYLAEGIPVFLSLERAVKALANVVGYHERRDAIASSD